MNKEGAPEMKKNENLQESNFSSREILEQQEFYNKIQEEISSVVIEQKNRDIEGNLLAPNGKISNLMEQDWKITRTPSFIKKFGNWVDKYNKEEFDLWIEYQRKQKLEDTLADYSRQIEYYTKQSKPFDQSDIIKQIKEGSVSLRHKVSELHAHLMNSNFNIHSSSLDYTKLLDENGEPLVLYRATNFNPNSDGKFIIPEHNYNNTNFQVGVFLGIKEEAKFHYEARKEEGKEVNLYKTFVNGRNFKFCNSKPDYSSPEEIAVLRNKYDGLWVNNYDKENNHTHDKEGNINLMDYVCFDPNNILITDIE